MDAQRLAEIRIDSFEPTRTLTWADDAIDDLIAEVDRRGIALTLALDALRSGATSKAMATFADDLVRYLPFAA